MNEHPLLMDVGPIPGLVVLFVLFGVSGGFFAYQVTKATRLVLLGKPDDRFDSWAAEIQRGANRLAWSEESIRGQGCRSNPRFDVLGILDAINRYV